MRLLIIILIYIALAVLCTVVVVAQENDTPIQWRLREFEAARAKWQANAYPHYRIHIHDTLTAGREGCEQELEIIGTQVKQVLRNTCNNMPLLTVENLFQFLDENLPRQIIWVKAIYRRCYVSNWNARYDQQFGFPVSIVNTLDYPSAESIGTLKMNRVVLAHGNYTAQCPYADTFYTPQLAISITPLS